MEVRRHADPVSFRALVGPLLRTAPARNTVLLTLLESLCREPDDGAVLLSLHDGDVLVGATVRTPPYGVVVSGVPVDRAAEIVGVDPAVPGYTGPVDVVEALLAADGRPVLERSDLRLFALEVLVPPSGVPGAPRAATADDLDLLVARLGEFADESGTRGVPVAAVRGWLAGSAVPVLWEREGEVVALAVARTAIAGTARISAVHTPREHRGRGFGAAVTAAACALAREAGAVRVVLFTDLANPVSNRLYPRIGFVAVEDHCEVRLQGWDGAVRLGGAGAEAAPVPARRAAAGRGWS